MPSIQYLIHHAEQRLRAAGSDSPRLDARVLLKHVSGLSDTDILAHPQRELPEDVVVAFEAAVARRLQREPVAYITGMREFWGLDFQVNPATLIPRPDSEVLISAVLEAFRGRETTPLRLLDIGTGSGCLLIALLTEWPNAFGVGLDASPQALALAAGNAATHVADARAGLLASHWLDALETRDAGGFDCIISNPPYIPAAEMAGLTADVREWEPPTALTDGGDGLDAYRMLARQMPLVLALGGNVFLESGAGQDAAVRDIMQQAGWRHVQTYQDLAGIARCQQFEWKS